ncbi:unnamed protein product [Pleuronectes platessa]|uniref:Uncharacterized protein n=1 Tax=Pleuronectes platessa TaxID=8262 RepID=A0A9N7VJJ4_PLEPL|nr:unnamed protein product [Pleuronectes platessa]
MSSSNYNQYVSLCLYVPRRDPDPDAPYLLDTSSAVMSSGASTLTFSPSSSTSCLITEGLLAAVRLPPRAKRNSEHPTPPAPSLPFGRLSHCRQVHAPVAAKVPTCPPYARLRSASLLLPLPTRIQLADHPKSVPRSPPPILTHTHHGALSTAH